MKQMNKFSVMVDNINCIVYLLSYSNTWEPHNALASISSSSSTVCYVEEIRARLSQFLTLIKLKITI